MAGLTTPRKDFRYVLEFNGANSFLIQEVTPPSVELTEVEHAAPGNIPNAKTPGKMKVGDLEVKKLKPAHLQDTWAWDMMIKAATDLQPNFTQVGFLKELGPDMVTTVETFFLGEAWVKKIDSSGYKGMGSENIIETVTFSVQFYFPTSSAQFNAIFGGTAAAAMGQAFAAGKA